MLLVQPTIRLYHTAPEHAAQWGHDVNHLYFAGQYTDLQAAHTEVLRRMHKGHYENAGRVWCFSEKHGAMEFVGMPPAAGGQEGAWEESDRREPLPLPPACLTAAGYETATWQHVTALYDHLEMGPGRPWEHYETPGAAAAACATEVQRLVG